MGITKIRKVKISDAKFFVSLSRQIGYPSEEKEIRQRLKNGLKQNDDVLFVAITEEQNVVGFVQGISRIEVLTPKTIILGGLVVDPKYQKLGIGRKLMNALEKYAKNNKYKMILVPTNIKRKNIHPFYEKIGYKKLKTQAVYAKEF